MHILYTILLNSVTEKKFFLGGPESVILSEVRQKEKYHTKTLTCGV